MGLSEARRQKIHAEEREGKYQAEHGEDELLVRLYPDEQLSATISELTPTPGREPVCPHGNYGCGCASYFPRDM